jgi:glutamyl/glutaminyl-tRNA synthetase
MRLLGHRRLPLYLHHPLIYAPTGEKLSKSAADTGVRELRALGLAPEQVLGHAAAAVGLAAAATPCAASAVRRLFED